MAVDIASERDFALQIARYIQSKLPNVEAPSCRPMGVELVTSLGWIRIRGDDGNLVIEPEQLEKSLASGFLECDSSLQRWIGCTSVKVRELYDVLNADSVDIRVADAPVDGDKWELTAMFFMPHDGVRS